MENRTDNSAAIIELRAQIAFKLKLFSENYSAEEIHEIELAQYQRRIIILTAEERNSKIKNILNEDE